MDRSETMRQMTEGLPLGTDVVSIRRRIEGLEQLLDNSFTLPVVNRRFGIDAIVGLVPGIGDAVTALMGLYIVWEARNLGLPQWKLWRMAGNVGLDALLGALPVAGDVFDLLYRSNTRNLRIVKRHLDKHHPGSALVEG